VKNVATLTPEKITTPRLVRLSAPGPVAKMSGTDPMSVENAVMTVTGTKLKSLAAGKMGYGTSEVGDLVVAALK